jgi:hypothetical protein
MMQTDCECWVSKMSAEFRFGVRWGSHDFACRRYQRSLDPVDDLEDSDLRAAFYAGSLDAESRGRDAESE